MKNPIILLSFVSLFERNYKRFSKIEYEKIGHDFYAIDLFRLFNIHSINTEADRYESTNNSFLVDDISQLKSVLRSIAELYPSDITFGVFNLMPIYSNVSSQVLTVVNKTINKYILLSEFRASPLEWLESNNQLRYLFKNFKSTIDFFLYNRQTGLLNGAALLSGPTANKVHSTVIKLSSIEKSIYIHHKDYDKYLSFKEQLKNTKDLSLCDDRYVVYIDNGPIDHTDYIILKEKPYASKSYFMTMNKLFDLFENYFGYQVVIASHPNVNLEKNQENYYPRPVFEDTYLSSLLHFSEFVVTQSSNADYLAVLFDKPICITTTNELKYSNWNSRIKASSELLDLKILNADELNEIHNDDIKSYIHKIENNRRQMIIEDLIISSKSDQTYSWNKISSLIETHKVF